MHEVTLLMWFTNTDEDAQLRTVDEHTVKISKMGVYKTQFLQEKI